jgi:hypothetical protein
VTQPELRALEQTLQALRAHPQVSKALTHEGQLEFERLELTEIADLLNDPAGALVLMAGANLNRTALRAGTATADAQLVPVPLRRAFVVRSQLPPRADFSTLVELALAQRRATLGRNVNAQTEALFRDRLAFEGLPIRMRGAWTSGLLVDRRKPDGVFPDPDSGRAPELYLEVKKINRVRDDVQKRLYEIAEASLEMKLLYGRLRLAGLDLTTLLGPDERGETRDVIRAQITAARPVVVALLLCAFEQIEYARRYRPNTEAFIDRVFFADEIDECIAFLAQIAPPGASAG